MSMSKNIARLAVTAGLTAALSFGGVMAPVTMAFAEDATTTTNSITINKNENNGDVKYKAYQIFEADVVDEPDNSDKVVSNVDWAKNLKNNDSVKAAIIEAIKGATGGDSLPEQPSAQDIADWLSDKNHVNTSTDTRLDKDHVLNKIAKAIIDNNIAQTGVSFKAGEPFNATSNGYYLFVTDENSLSTPQVAKANTGTSPIFAVVGGKGVTVVEKTKIPTINKQILNDNKEKQGGYTVQDGWSYVADSQVGQEISYKLTGSIADNYATYDSYAYKFTDTLTKGLTYVGSLEVYAQNGQNYTKIDPNTYNVDVPTGDNGVLTVNFNKEKGLKSATAANADETLKIGAETKIVVFYKAKLNSKANYDAAGNTNNVYLEYSNNPMAEGTGKSEIKVVTDHVFRLDVTKVDKDHPETKLQAGFKVKVVANEDGASVGKWLASDGSFVNTEQEAHEFTTSSGTDTIYIPGLDAGKYLISETTTPAGYNTVAPFEITVTPSYKNNGDLDTLTVSSNNEEMTVIKDANGATIPLTIKNKKGSGLPLTGLNGVTFTWIAGGAVLCIGVAHLIRSRKQAEESEQE